MFKRIVTLVILLLLFTGCNNKVEEEKNEYLNTKAMLETNTDFSDVDSFPCEITVSLDRIIVVTPKATLLLIIVPKLPGS